MDQEKRFRQIVSPRLRLGCVLSFAFLLLIGLLLLGYAYRWTGFRDQTLWDWLQLLLAVVVTVMIAYLGQRISQRQYQGQQEAEEKRAQAEALQGYLDQMGQLLLDKERPLRQSKEGEEVRILARARTYTAALMLGTLGRGSMVRFLYEAGLIGKDAPVVDLDDVYMQGASMMSANLQKADLRKAFLAEAFLISANLKWADLRETHLSRASLTDAKLTGADLRRAILDQANLGWANLQGADLRKAVLADTDLSGADLSGADLRDVVGWAEEQLRQAKSLEGTTMPDGQTLKGNKAPDGPTFEEWLKSQSSNKDA